MPTVTGFQSHFNEIKELAEKGFSLEKALQKTGTDESEFYAACDDLQASELVHIAATHSLRPTRFCDGLQRLSHLDNSIIRTPFGDDLSYVGWL